ncbi:MAG: alpha/beta hydrolase family protein, partial [Longimicrobiales bacterium]
MTRRMLVPVVFILSLPLAVAAQPRPISPADYGKWESLGGATLAPGGDWLAYAVSRVTEENELRIRGIERDTTILVAYGESPAFSGGGDWLAYAIGVSSDERERLTEEEKPVKERAAIVNLSTLETVEVDDIASFRFSGDGRFLALHAYPPEDKHAAVLIVRDLERGTTTTFGDVSDFAWSDAGALLALTLETENGAGNAVQLYDARSGTIRVLDSSTALYRALAWREDAPDLAVLRTRADSAFRDTTHVLLAWRDADGETPSRIELDPAATNGIPADMRIAEHFAPSWSDDGETLFFGLRPRERAERKDSTAVVAADSANGEAPGDSARDTAATKEKRSDVQVWHARDVRIMPMQKAQEEQDLERTLLAAWHPAEDRVIRIGNDLFESTTVLGDGRWAVETDRKPYAFGTMFGRESRDIWLIDVRTGDRRKALEDVRWYYGPSPTGEHLLWFDGEDYRSYDVASGTRTNLTERVDADFANRDYDYPVDRLPAWGFAGWTKDDRALLAYDVYDVWSIAPDGSGASRLTNGAAEGVVHRYRSIRDDDDGIDATKPLYFALAGKTTKKAGFARLNPG